MSFLFDKINKEKNEKIFLPEFLIHDNGDRLRQPLDLLYLHLH
jgi:hypothetical protein